MSSLAKFLERPQPLQYDLQSFVMSGFNHHGRIFFPFNFKFLRISLVGTLAKQSWKIASQDLKTRVQGGTQVLNPQFSELGNT